MRTLTGNHACLFVLTAVALSIGPAPAAGSREPLFGPGLDFKREFSAIEGRDLTRGELVVRQTSKRQGGKKLIGGTSWQLIKAPVKDVWDVVLDMSYYDRILPQVKDVQLVHEAGDSRTLFIRHGNSMVNICYVIEMNADASRHEVNFKVNKDRRCSVEAGWGFYAIRPYGKDETVLVYGIMADIGEGLIPALMRGLIHEWMLKIPLLVKKVVEKNRRRKLKGSAGSKR